MQVRRHFLIVDTDATTAALCRSLLTAADQHVTFFTSDALTPDLIAELKPDCIISDFTLSPARSLDLLEAMRRAALTKQPAVLILTDNQQVLDYPRIFALQVHGYCHKPLAADTWLTTVLKALAGKMTLHCWGARGTLPVPGTDSIRYGGNTNCLTLQTANQFLIFDGGTGLKPLATHLLRTKQLPFSATFFFSHPHYDHINGVPFFVPFYMPNNKFAIYGMKHSGMGIEQLISDQMDTVYFPVTISEFRSQLTFHDITPGTFYLDELKIDTTVLTHPGKALGYRIQYLNQTFCYITDNELYLEDSPHYDAAFVEGLIAFLKDVDVVFIDATYQDRDYPSKVGWGHSCISRVVDIADRAAVKRLYLHHHDPDQTDDDIDAKLAFAKELLDKRHSRTQCYAATEGETITF